MKTLAIALAATTALAFGALAQTQPQNAPAAQSQTTTTKPSAATAAQSGTATTTRSGSAATTRSGVNIRANIRTGSSRTVIRDRSRGPSVVYSRSRTRYVTTVDDRPSRVTVIKKKKKYAKKKRTRIYAVAPSTSTTIIERRRRGVLVGGGVSRSRVITRDSGVRARIGVSTSPRSTTGSGTTTTSKPAGNVTGSGSAGTSKPAATGTTGTTTTTAPAQSR